MDDVTTGRLGQLRAMLKEEPRDAFLLYAIALELKAQRDLPAATMQFEELLVIDPRNIPGHYQLALVLSELGRRAEAIERIRKGLRLATEQRDMKAVGELRELLQGLDEDE